MLPDDHEHLSDKPDIRSIYTKPDSAMLNSGKVVYCPEHIRRLYVQPHMIVRIARVGKFVEHEFAHRYWEQVGVGFSLCGLDDVRDALKTMAPHVPYSGFDGSLVQGSMMTYDKCSDRQLTFIYGDERRLIELLSRSTVDTYLSMLSRYFMLKIGDLLTFPLLPAYEPVTEGDDLYIAWGEEELAFVGIR
ncbi:hypothetical protein [Porphyromonas sp.]|uniref:hypothetical protein n=1 Tax=Porphyromonas sp. TaxID=1924944 RepID=UPI0026DDA334|nr:hypothetical protein [Porphyromonas sp.]MDO4695511.1 hypothetical protein [Porphyromonas sp.]MDO4770248.1 hypothetical protein [Porphyromonas sp.]